MTDDRKSDRTAHAEIDAIRNAGPTMLDIENKKFLNTVSFQ